LTISYQEIGDQIEINKKGQIRSAGFTPLGWYMICKSHGFEPVDMLVIIAEICTGHQRNAVDNITGLVSLNYSILVGEYRNLHKLRTKIFGF